MARSLAKRSKSVVFSSESQLEEFCMLVLMLDSKIALYDDNERVLSPSRTRFDVELKPNVDTAGTPRRRVLVLDTQHRVLERWKRSSTLMELVHSERLRPRSVVRVGPGPLDVTLRGRGPTTAATRITFPSTLVREKFLGLVRWAILSIPRGPRSASVSSPPGQIAGLSSPVPTAATSELSLDSTFTGRNLKVFTATWNVSETSAPMPKALSKWIIPRSADIYAIGLQECSNVADWASAIEGLLSSRAVTLDVTHGRATVTATRRASSLLAGDHGGSASGGGSNASAGSEHDGETHGSKGRAGGVTMVREGDLGAAAGAGGDDSPGSDPDGPGGSGSGTGGGFDGGSGSGSDGGPTPQSKYNTIATVSLWGIHIILVVRSSLTSHVTQLSSSTKAMGVAGVMGNKGAAGVSITLDDTTSLAFVSSHLAARPDRVAQRNADYRGICRGLSLGPERGELEFLDTHSHVFWVGDLNYRIDRGFLDVTKWGGVDHSAFMDGLRVSISATRQQKDKDKRTGGSYTEYVVDVVNGAKEWQVFLRYSKILEVHLLLEAFVRGGVKLPRIPPKKLLGSSLISKFVEKRRQQLGEYLHAVAHIPSVWRCREFVQLLDSPDSHLEQQFSPLWERTGAKEFKEVISLITATQWDELARSDQLLREMNDSKVFIGFLEGPLRFAPTYRMNKGRPGYSNKRNQNPSYTDRVLWRSRAGFRADVRQTMYDAVPDLMQSDHRPVHASFEVATRLPFVALPAEPANGASASRGDGAVASNAGGDTATIVFTSLEFTGSRDDALAVGGDGGDGGDDGDGGYGGVVVVGGDDSSVGGGTGASAAGAAAGAGASGISGADPSGGAPANSVCVQFRCSFAPAAQTTYVALEAGGTARWDHASTPRVQSNVCDVRWVRRQQVQLIVRNARGALVGSADVVLHRAFDPTVAASSAARLAALVMPEAAAEIGPLLPSKSEGSSFAVRVLRSGMPVGLLRGTVAIVVTRPLAQRISHLRQVRRALVSHGRGRRLSSRDFLESLRVGIPTTDRRKDAKKAYTVYNVQVTSGATWTVSRRFNEFYTLNSALRAQLGTIEDLPKMPGKVIIGSSLRSAVVEKRRHALETYMQELCSLPAAWRCTELIQFLDNDAGTLTAQVLLHRLLDHTREATLFEDAKKELRQRIRAVIALKALTGGRDFSEAMDDSGGSGSPAGGTRARSSTEVSRSARLRQANQMMSEFIGVASGDGDSDGDGGVVYEGKDESDSSSGEFWIESSDEEGTRASRRRSGVAGDDGEGGAGLSDEDDEDGMLSDDDDAHMGRLPSSTHAARGTRAHAMKQGLSTEPSHAHRALGSSASSSEDPPAGTYHADDPVAEQFGQYWRLSQFKRGSGHDIRDSAAGWRDGSGHGPAGTAVGMGQGALPAAGGTQYRYGASVAERLGGADAAGAGDAVYDWGYSARFGYGRHGVGSISAGAGARYETGVFNNDGLFVPAHIHIAPVPSATPFHLPGLSAEETHAVAQAARPASSPSEVPAAAGAVARGGATSRRSPPDADAAGRTSGIGESSTPDRGAPDSVHASRTIPAAVGAGPASLGVADPAPSTPARSPGLSIGLSIGDGVTPEGAVQVASPEPSPTGTTPTALTPSMAPTSVGKVPATVISALPNEFRRSDTMGSEASLYIESISVLSRGESAASIAVSLDDDSADDDQGKGAGGDTVAPLRSTSRSPVQAAAPAVARAALQDRRTHSFTTSLLGSDLGVDVPSSSSGVGHRGARAAPAASATHFTHREPVAKVRSFTSALLADGDDEPEWAAPPQRVQGAPAAIQSSAPRTAHGAPTASGGANGGNSRDPSSSRAFLMSRLGGLDG